MAHKSGWIAVGLVSWFWVAPAYALAPPQGDETLCSVLGVVQSVMQEEMRSTAADATAGQRVNVPVVVMELISAAPVDAAYKGAFCARLMAPSTLGAQPIGYFRLCDAAAEFMTGQTIRGVVGLSKGGGRYCIAQINAQTTQ